MEIKNPLKNQEVERNWRTFIEDFRTFCLTAPESSKLLPALAEAGLQLSQVRLISYK